jgi:hypothetical protein
MNAQQTCTLLIKSKGFGVHVVKNNVKMQGATDQQCMKFMNPQLSYKTGGMT